MKPQKLITIPQDSVSDDFVTIIAVNFDDGSLVDAGETILEYETSKSVVAVESPGRGFLALNCKVGSIAQIGATVAALFNENDQEVRENWKSTLAIQGTFPATEDRDSDESGDAVFSVRADELIVKNNLDKAIFDGKGYVSIHDVKAHLVESNSAQPKARSLRRHGFPERIVAVAVNEISAEMLEDLVSDVPGQELIGYVNDEPFRNDLDLPFFECDIFDFPKAIDPDSYDSVIIAAAGSKNSMLFRKRVFQFYTENGVRFANLVSRSARISRGVSMGLGNVIEAGVYIGPHAQIQDNNFISYSAVIGHHSSVGSSNLFAPGVTMAGLVEIGNDCVFPTGVNFSDKVKIGNDVVVPVGHNINSNLLAGTVIKFSAKA